MNGILEDQIREDIGHHNDAQFSTKKDKKILLAKEGSNMFSNSARLNLTHSATPIFWYLFAEKLDFLLAAGFLDSSDAENSAQTFPGISMTELAKFQKKNGKLFQ